MTEELMVGTRGWDYDDWVDDYYSDDLPDDWRFAYYSNEHRAVLVPADHFTSDGDDVVSEWVEDCDKEFRFIVEISKACLLNVGETALQTFLKELSPLRPFLAGYYLPLGAATSVELELLQARVELLQPHAPVCIDCDRNSQISDQLDRLVSENNIGLCWHPESGDAPTAGGALMLVLSDEENPRAQRSVIEALEQWMQQSHGLAGLFLKNPAASSQARIIAEMLGI